MTSSILSRLEAELNMMIETRADIRIIEVRMSCSNYSQILREYADRLRYGIGSTSMTGMSLIQFMSIQGPVMVRPFHEMEDHELAFKTETGEMIYPIDEEVNRILLGY